MIELNKVYIYEKEMENMYFIFKSMMDDFYISDIITTGYDGYEPKVMSDRLISSDPNYYLYKELKPIDPMSFRRVITLCFTLPFQS